MTKIYLGLGSNLGDCRANIEDALALLGEQVRIIRRSSYYETEPVGFHDQPWFLNLVVEAETEMDPIELLAFTQSIEKRLKRVKTIVNGPRTIDLDILLYDEISLISENLTIPHPRMRQRAFVMAPLNEIAPDLELEGSTVRDIFHGLKGEQIRKVID